MMKLRSKFGIILGGFIAVMLAVWCISILPFACKIEQTVPADVYKDGAVIDKTFIYMNGSKTRYLFRDDSFVGEFRIPYLEKTDIDGLQTKIQWQKDVEFQRISHFYKGAFSTSDRYGIACYMLISRNMQEFAVMTTQNEIIATSETAYRLCADHLSYNDGGSVTVKDADDKLSLE